MKKSNTQSVPKGKQEEVEVKAHAGNALAAILGPTMGVKDSQDLADHFDEILQYLINEKKSLTYLELTVLIEYFKVFDLTSPESVGTKYLAGVDKGNNDKGYVQQYNSSKGRIATLEAITTVKKIATEVYAHITKKNAFSWGTIAMVPLFAESMTDFRNDLLANALSDKSKLLRQKFIWNVSNFDVMLELYLKKTAVWEKFIHYLTESGMVETRAKGFKFDNGKLSSTVFLGLNQKGLDAFAAEALEDRETPEILPFETLLASPVADALWMYLEASAPLDVKKLLQCQDYRKARARKDSSFKLIAKNNIVMSHIKDILAKTNRDYSGMKTGFNSHTDFIDLYYKSLRVFQASIRNMHRVLSPDDNGADTRSMTKYTKNVKTQFSGTTKSIASMFIDK